MLDLNGFPGMRLPSNELLDVKGKSTATEVENLFRCLPVALDSCRTHIRGCITACTGVIPNLSSIPNYHLIQDAWISRGDAAL